MSEVIQTGNQTNHFNEGSTLKSSSGDSNNNANKLKEKDTLPHSKKPQTNRPKFVFRCQKAEGSPTGLISGFSNVKELYQKIAECFGFPVEDVLYCTLNTHRVDVERLLGAQLCLEDFIFVHRKGIKKEVEIVKTEDALGLTITDNGNGYSFIKRIRDGSIIQKTGVIQPGDHIEKINGKSVIDWRHIDVARYLKSIPVGSILTLRLIEPLKAGFGNLGPRRSKKVGLGQGNYVSGKETIRFRGNAPAILESSPDSSKEIAISKINALLDNFMGISDTELATHVWELAHGTKNTMSFAEVLDNSELESFGFNDDFIIEVWEIVNNSKKTNADPEEINQFPV